MSQREFTVIVEEDETGLLVGSVPELPGCHTQAESLDELFVLIRDAIRLYLKDEAEADPPLRWVGVHRVAV